MRGAPTDSMWCAGSSREAGKHLTPNGVLVVEIGRGRKLLEREFPNLPFLWLDTAESAGEVFALTRSDLDEQGSR